MTTRLWQHAFARVDQDHGKIGSRCPRHHIAGILLMSRAIGDDKLAFFRSEETIGDVDRYTLFALGRQAVDQ